MQTLSTKIFHLTFFFSLNIAVWSSVGPERLSIGGRQIESVFDWDKAEQQAKNYYERIRATNSNADIVSISKNTGISEYRI